MTRKEAIQVLQTALTSPLIYGDYAEAIDMAIEALHREEAEEKGWCHRIRPKEYSPSAEPKTGEWIKHVDELSATNKEKSSNCGDLISRADAMGTVQDHFNADGFKGYDDGQKMMDRIKALPSADRPTGRWVRSGNTLICPIYGAKGEDIKDDYCFNYCPNCGADMRNQNNEQR